ncbi:rhodanese domain-containing protein [Rhizobium grahamii CCGE 502]|uniref:Rhodanese domain-containing protein n=1 Tax=Rhizobium grahamii CCGE 502 TaxID=990285 RepID=S3HEQ5_9HYPH|nr:rhodanese domain-containing protein [Rhizobium grahamii CCGE 502]
MRSPDEATAEVSRPCPGHADRFCATPFDIEEVYWSHRGELCTFDIMVDEFGLGTEPMLRLATIIRGADTSRLDVAPDSHGRNIVLKR